MPRRKSRTPATATPFDVGLRLWEAQWKTAEMMSSAGWTIALRSWGLGASAAGLRPHDARENGRMVSEKVAASQEAALALMRAGGWSLDAYAAMLRPYHRRTTANARRLSRKKG